MAQEILVVGSIAFDSIETPAGVVADELGGSATHFSIAASYFAPVRLVGVVGSDFPRQHIELLERHGIDTGGLTIQDDGQTFRWQGRYHGAMNEAETVSVALNVFGDFEPQIPEHYRATPFVFLANGSPQTQRATLEQLTAPRFIVMDSMNLWIHTQRDALLDMIGRVDCLVCNEDEARDLTDRHNLVSAGRQIQRLGPQTVVVKKGQHGALLFHEGGCFPMPALPLDDVVDPTGAGDSFAGGFLGALARGGEVNLDALRNAMVYATVLASYNVEAFGLRRTATLDHELIEQRLQLYVETMTPIVESRLV